MGMRIKMRRFLTAVLRFLRNVVLIDLGIFAVVGLICWFGGWRTAFHWQRPDTGRGGRPGIRCL